VGAIADVLWSEIRNHTKNVELGEYTVMPNHVHGILILLRADSKVEQEDFIDSGISDVKNVWDVGNAMNELNVSGVSNGSDVLGDLNVSGDSKVSGDSNVSNVSGV